MARRSYSPLEQGCLIGVNFFMNDFTPGTNHGALEANQNHPSLNLFSMKVMVLQTWQPLDFLLKMTYRK